VPRTALVVLLLAAALLFPAAAGRPTPRRVVSTFLCTDEYVFRLVGRDRIAALSYEATDRHPVVSTIAEAAAGIATIHPSAETVLALAPDLVVMYQGVNPRLRDALKKLGIRVLDVPWANSTAEIRSVTAMLGRELGNPNAAEAMIREMDKKIAAARAKAPSPPVSAILYQPNGYALSSGYTTELMTAAGLRDVAPALALSRQGRLPVEAVVAGAPQLLILGGEETSGSALAYRVLHHPALQALQGRTDTEFAVLTELMCPGPWSAEAAATFGRMARKALAREPVRP
jgi:iron complex transport system substrate-binding protein